MRTCRMCGEDKPATEYHKGHAKCKECYRAISRAYYHRTKPPLKERKRLDPEIVRARKRAAAYLKRYGITEEQRDEMLAAQGGVCAICREEEPSGRGWCTDHDHACCSEKARSCGRCIRGILCYSCNTLLGHAKDSPRRLAAAIDYLSTWSANAP